MSVPKTTVPGVYTALTGAGNELYEIATEKKQANIKAIEAGASREKEALVHVHRCVKFPIVVFNQGFGAGVSGVLAGLPTDAGIEPGLADFRIERVHQYHCAQVHLEVSGTSAAMNERSHLFVKVEKLRQQDRTGDNKVFLLLYDCFSENGSEPGKKIVTLRIPPEALKKGGPLDISGTARELQARFPENSQGVQARFVQGQLMLCLPPDTPFQLTKAQFSEHLFNSLNAKVRHGMKLGVQDYEYDFYYEKFHANKPLLADLNKAYLQARAQLTLKDGQVRNLGGLEQAQLKRLGALNDKEVVAQYRQAMCMPDHKKTKSVGMD